MTESELFSNDQVNGWVVCTPTRADGFALLAPAPEPVFQDWSQWSTGVHVTGCAVVPASTYEIVAVTPDGSESAPLIVKTVAQPLPKQWGDVVGYFDGTEWTPPNGDVNMDDVTAAIWKFQQPAGPPHFAIVDVAEDLGFVNFTDIFLLVQAFKGEAYPYGCENDPCCGEPDPCPDTP